ncbi:MAG: TolC family protein [Bacteroidota bacterium]|nr:TolC family protein [Bacteroidota bacterium]
MKTHAIAKTVYQNLLIVAFSIFSPAMLIAQTTAGSEFSLQQAIDYALKNQVDIKNAQLDAEIARARTNELIAVGLPQVNGTADMNKYLEIPTQFVPAEFFNGEPGTFAPVQFGQPYTASAGINASQLLFDGTYLVGLKAAKTYVELARKGLTSTRIETAVNVSKAYYYVLVTKERAKQLTVDLSRLGKLRDDTKALFDNGFVEKIDADRIALSYNLVESALSQTQRLVTNSYNLLKFQMGMDINTPITLTENIASVNFDTAVTPTDSVNIKSRIEYSILETQHELAGYDLKRYKTARWPSLRAFGNLSTNASRNEFNFFESGYKWYPSSIIGISLSVPIFGGYKIGFQVKQAELNRQKVENSFYTLEQGIKLEHENAMNTFQSNIDQLKTEDKNRNLAREIARISKIKYDQGVGSNLEVIDAESSLRDAEANYYVALLETIISKIDLDKALGNYKY